MNPSKFFALAFALLAIYSGFNLHKLEFVVFSILFVFFSFAAHFPQNPTPNSHAE